MARGWRCTLMLLLLTAAVTGDWRRRGAEAADAAQRKETDALRALAQNNAPT